MPVILFASLWLSMDASYTPSEIVDFHPLNFQAKADESFFYSIGNELKHSDHIDPQSPTLARGKVGQYLVAPDKRKIAVAGDGHLFIVSLDNPTFHQVTTVDSIYREPKPIGRSFFRDQEFQWARDSNALYLIKDKFYESQGSQLFSQNGELWKYDLKEKSLRLVLKPFPADNYFFDAKSKIYFSVPTDSGDLILKNFDGRDVSDVPTETVETIPTSRLAANVTIKSPFYSFYSFDYPRFARRDNDMSIVFDEPRGLKTLSGKTKQYLTLTRGEGFKGSYYCDDPSKSLSLPGDRYFLLSVSCKNYDGQLLIDTQTANYQTLPKDTRIYLTLNTDTYPHYHISGGGISIR
ncbi:hypothetical protein [Acidicapsa acidisoli]|uniref:hypothetical protein n=1 Tax=Acidicapsa acidisoli TaxID=1615681 RepID=UPI0021E0FAD5|nr:hypothetical protein [Acidicapsa acidisoli]